MDIFKQFIKSLYSPSFISKFRFQKVGRGILYIFFLVLITTLPASIILGTSFSYLFDQTEKHLTETLPDFTIEDGKLYSNSTKPIIENEKNITIIFDSTGEIKVDSIDESVDTFALLEDQVVIYAEGVKEVSSYGETNFTKTEFVKLFQSIHGISPLLIGLIIILLFLFSAAMKFVGITFLALISFLINKAMGTLLNVKQCWMISAYSVTLPTVILAIIDLFKFYLPYSITIYWIITFVMLYKVLKLIQTSKQTSVANNLSKI